MENNPIQAAIAEFEAAAALATEHLLAVQDDYLRSLELVDLLKKHRQRPDALDLLKVSLIDQTDYMDLIIYGTSHNPADINAALAAAGLVVESQTRGYSDYVNRWHVSGYPTTKLYMPADMIPIAQALPEAA